MAGVILARCRVQKPGRHEVAKMAFFQMYRMETGQFSCRGLRLTKGYKPDDQTCKALERARENERERERMRERERETERQTDRGGSEFCRAGISGISFFCFICQFIHAFSQTSLQSDNSDLFWPGIWVCCQVE